MTQQDKYWEKEKMIANAFSLYQQLCHKRTELLRQLPEGTLDCETALMNSIKAIVEMD